MVESASNRWVGQEYFFDRLYTRGHPPGREYWVDNMAVLTFNPRKNGRFLQVQYLTPNKKQQSWSGLDFLFDSRCVVL